MSVEPRAVVLLSGGMDSAVALAAARAEGMRCYALSVDYGQRHRSELSAAARVARQLDAVEHSLVRVDLAAFGGSALTDPAIAVPKDRPADHIGVGVPATYVPARNLVLLSLAAAFAETRGADDVFIGVNAIDYSGYPDCRQPFLDAFAQAARLGTRAGAQGRPLKIHAPLSPLSKGQIVRLANALGVDLALTISCYDADDSGLACGRCDACALRRRGFADAGVPDATRYRAGAPA